MSELEEDPSEAEQAFLDWVFDNNYGLKENFLQDTTFFIEWKKANNIKEETNEDTIDKDLDDFFEDKFDEFIAYCKEAYRTDKL